MRPTMADSHPSPVPPPAQALGRIPSGLFILTVRSGGQATGMLVSWVQQAGFDPPLISVALRRDRYVADWVAETGRFTLNQIRSGQKPLLRHFARGFAEGEDAFAGLALRREGEGCPVLVEALSHLDAQVVGECGEGEHRLFLARVVGGEVHDTEAEPMLHVRKNGLHY
jgi:flavin reductase (DIM6/NTAB) family NADH-FMN oxidoreductase RutF